MPSQSIGTYWLLLDLAFVVAIETLYKRQARPAVEYLPSADKSVIDSLLMEIENKSVPLIQEFLQGWFECSSAEVGRSDFLEWGACMCYNVSPDALTESQCLDINILIASLEKKLGYSFREGYGNINFKMLLTLDPVEIFHRPLFFYASIMGIDACARLALWKYSFKRTADRGMVTYIKRGRSGNNELPIIFFHGIGVGLGPYLRFLFALVERFPDRTILAFEKKAISMQLTSKIMLPEEYAAKVFQKLHAEKIEKIVAVGHSLGTMVICWLDKYYPGLVHSRVFMDPVCFTLWTHDIAKNFIYRSPKELQHYLLKYFASMEPGISLYLRRYFVWYKNTYFTHELPKNSQIYFSENDDIVNTKYVTAYLARFPHPDRSFDVIPRVRHGQHLLAGCLDPILDDIERLS